MPKSVYQVTVRPQSHSNVYMTSRYALNDVTKVTSVTDTCNYKDSEVI